MSSTIKGLVLPVIASVLLLLIYHIIFVPKVAFVDTSKLLVGFSEAANVDREVKAEEEKWKGQYKVLQDSLQLAINAMSKEYNNAPVAKKKELQNILTIRNQQINNFQSVNLRKMEELRKSKMQGVFEKTNVYLAEYGKKHKYSIIFGTAAGGSILYGNEKKFDITDDIIKGLNERYK